MNKPTSPQSVKNIDPKRLALLNSGAIESAHLTECFAIDFATLLQATLPKISTDTLAAVECEAQTGISKRMALVGNLLLGTSNQKESLKLILKLQKHPSDTVRGWACFMIGALSELPLPQRITAIAPLADDSHWGVREWAWLAVRPHLAANLNETIAILKDWALDPSEYLRRFACESIRPRGVWCAHISTLKTNPEQALPILEPLRSDPSNYVQDSVSNWLNDAAKDQPQWVAALCKRWEKESPTTETKRISKRAQRSIKP